MASRATLKQDRAIEALLSCRTVPEAAKMAGVHLRHMFRLLASQDFRRRYEEARERAFNHTIQRLQSHLWVATETLIEVASDPNAPLGPRVSAARGILEIGLRCWETQQIVQRIQQLEERINEQQNFGVETFKTGAESLPRKTDGN